MCSHCSEHIVISLLADIYVAIVTEKECTKQKKIPQHRKKEIQVTKFTVKKVNKMQANSILISYQTKTETY